MMNTFLIGVDLGTSATKAALYDTSGTLISEITLPVPIKYLKPGVVEQDSEDFYLTASQAVSTCILQSGVDSKLIKAIAFDSQMAGVGTIDEEYRSTTRFDSWLDMRCQPYITMMDERAGERVTSLTGCAPTCAHGPKILWWQHERPQEYARIAKFLMPAAYVSGRMAGLDADEAFIDYTFLHFSGLSDARKGEWSQELCSMFGVDMERLPRIVEPWHVVGEVTQQAAGDFGLAPGTLIAAGCGDTAAGALGAGVVRAGMIFDTAGTASVLAGCTDSYVADIQNRALLTMRSVIPGLWNPLAYIGGGGQALTWFRDKFFNTSLGQAEPAVTDLYTAMDSMVTETPPGAEGLFFSPHLGGRICPSSPGMRGAWIGFSWGHSQAHFFRAILESVAFEYAYYLRILKDSIPDLALTEARVIGGGARSQTWNQIKANVLGVPFQTLQRSEFGTWGSAMIAGKAAGIYTDLVQVALENASPNGHPLQPDPEQHAFYQPLVERYIHLQETLTGYFQH